MVCERDDLRRVIREARETLLSTPDTVCPERARLGTASSGPTAILNSVAELEPRQFWTGGYNLNLTLGPIDQRQPDSPVKVEALVDSFFASGGQELQINALDAQVLRDAQSHPEEFPELLVRVAGFTARFVDLSTPQQEEIIERAECAAAGAGAVRKDRAADERG